MYEIILINIYNFQIIINYNINKFAIECFISFNHAAEIVLHVL